MPSGCYKTNNGMSTDKITYYFNLLLPEGPNGMLDFEFTESVLVHKWKGTGFFPIPKGVFTDLVANLAEVFMPIIQVAGETDNMSFATTHGSAGAQGCRSAG